MTNNSDIPPDFLKGAPSDISKGHIPRNKLHDYGDGRGLQLPTSSEREEPITPLELAFTIQDPCGNTAITLACEVLKLISDREDDGICQSLIHEIQDLNSKYTRG